MKRKDVDNISRQAGIRYNICISEVVDTILYMFAHVNSGDYQTQSIYTPSYISRMEKEKDKIPWALKDLEARLKNISEYASKVEAFMSIIFYSGYHYKESPEEFFKRLGSISSKLRDASSENVFTGHEKFFNNLSPDKLDEFIRLAEEEYRTFYKAYHQARIDEFNKRKKKFEDFVNDKLNIEPINRVFTDYYLDKWIIIVSEGMLNCGRALRIDYEKDENGCRITKPCVILKLPSLLNNMSELWESYFFTVHESTHLISEPISDHVLRSYSDVVSIRRPSHDIRNLFHNLYENFVLYSDLLLFKEYGGDLFEVYQVWLAASDSNKWTRGLENDFYNSFEKMRRTMKDVWRYEKIIKRTEQLIEERKVQDVIRALDSVFTEGKMFKLVREEYRPKW